MKILNVPTKLTEQQAQDARDGLLIVTPIALTDQWFIDFGFTAIVDNDTGLGLYQKGNVTVFFSPIRFVGDITYNEQKVVTVDCVHHLQNVVKKLTGEMLTK